MPLPNESSASVARPLGGNEEMFWSFDACFPTNFALFARVQGALDDRALRVALAKLQARHPLMRAHIEMRDGRAWFAEGAPPIDLERQVGTREFAIEHLAHAAHTPFDLEGGPLVRAVWVEHAPDDSTLALVFQHSSSDGRSGINAVRDWVQALNEPDAELPVLEPFPYIARLLPRESRLQRAVRGAQRTAWLMNAGSADKSVWLATEADAPPSERGVTAHERHLSPAQTKALSAKCREHGTTVHGALQAAAGLTLAGRVNASSANTLTFGQAVDIRGQASRPLDDHCGCLISAISTRERVEPEEGFWPLARRLSDRVHEGQQKSVERFVLDVGFPNLGQIGRHMSRRFPAQFGSLMERMHTPGLTLSNLGRIDLGEQTDKALRVEHMGLVVNPGITSSFAHSAATLDGELTWMFMGTLPLISSGTIASIASEAVERIVAAT